MEYNLHGIHLCQYFRRDLCGQPLPRGGGRERGDGERGREPGRERERKRERESDKVNDKMSRTTNAACSCKSHAVRDIDGHCDPEGGGYWGGGAYLLSLATGCAGTSALSGHATASLVSSVTSSSDGAGLSLEHTHTQVTVPMLSMGMCVCSFMNLYLFVLYLRRAPLSASTKEKHIHFAIKLI